MKKNALALFIAAVLTSSLFAGCGASQEASSSAEAKSESAAPTEEKKEEAPAEEQKEEAPAEEPSSDLGMTIATNNFGQGEYSLDINCWIVESTASALGSKADVVDNQFTIDNIITQLRSQLTKNPDGVCMFGVAETVYPAIAKACDEANVPYAFFAAPPLEQDVADMSADPLYAGTVLFDAYGEGVAIAEKALEDGCRKALICAGGEGQWTHDQRVIGFTDTFEAGGGKVLNVARCSDPSEGVAKISNLVSSSRDFDCGYGCGAGFVTAFESVKDSMGSDALIYGSDITPNLIQDVVDGKVEMLTGGASTSAAYATLLVINNALGKPILDENGKVPYFTNMTLVSCTKDNCETFANAWADCGPSPLSAEEVQKLCVATNPDVTFDDFVESLTHCGENTMKRLEDF